MEGHRRGRSGQHTCSNARPSLPRGTMMRWRVPAATYSAVSSAAVLPPGVEKRA